MLFGTSYWNEVIDFEKLVARGMIAAGDLAFFYRSDDIDEAYAYIVLHLSGNEQKPSAVH